MLANYFLPRYNFSDSNLFSYFGIRLHVNFISFFELYEKFSLNFWVTSHNLSALAVGGFKKTVALLHS